MSENITVESARFSFADDPVLRFFVSGKLIASYRDARVAKAFMAGWLMGTTGMKFLDADDRALFAIADALKKT